MSQLQVDSEWLEDANGDAANYTDQIARGAHVEPRMTGIFTDHEIRAMRSALKRICERLGIRPGSGDHTSAAMAIVYRAGTGGADEAQLVEHMTAGALSR